MWAELANQALQSYQASQGPQPAVGGDSASGGAMYSINPRSSADSSAAFGSLYQTFGGIQTGGSQSTGGLDMRWIAAIAAGALVLFFVLRR